ncbi:MAG: 4Fe-4S dicluster domain-containing protein [Deltaproteobacteria bacterium]|nr:4Fe-4S dicluster domain-containing protein [Deltaproteobacteria bacterium]
MTETKNHHAATETLRERLNELPGAHWRSLEELAGTEQFEAVLENEYPRAAALLSAGVSRRDFLRLMAASLALAGLGACGRKPNEPIIPYVQQPEDLILGKPVFYATAFTLAGFATGVLVESHEGRPVKIEGNPQHPASLGATNAFAQAAILDLYDPERSQVLLQDGRISTWDAFAIAAGARMAIQRQKRGAGLRIVTGRVTSPTLGRQMRVLAEQFPQAKWLQYEAVSQDNTRDGARLAFGQDANTLYRFDRADVILALDGDFLFSEPGSLRYARDFAARRKVRGATARMNRLYAAEPTPSITGAMADHRLAITAGDIAALAEAVARRLGIKEVGGDDAQALIAHAGWIDAVVADLREHRGSSLVIAGGSQPPRVQALAHALNQFLGNAGTTVVYTEPIEEQFANRVESLQELTREMAQGTVEAIFILDSNPVFSAPADLRFAEALIKVPFRAHLGLYADETSALCHWHIPQTHFLETWGDARSYDGTSTILQPLIAPLYAGKSEYEVAALLNDKAGASAHDLVRDTWRARVGENEFEVWWRRVLRDGLIAGTGAAPKTVSMRAQSLAPPQASAVETTGQGLELVFRPDPSIWDGRFANNSWLQELPKPMTKLTWDNAALISAATAGRLGLTNGDGVELSLGGNRVVAPVWINPGQADDSVTVNLGYGRTHTGGVGRGAGFNAYRLRTTAHQWFGRGLEIKKTGERVELATTQHHHRMEGRHLVRSATLEEYRRHPELFHETGHAPAPHVSLYPEHKSEAVNAWGMAIDTNICIGCNACVVACQAENNIPVVGKAQVAKGREMHWLRVDRYYEGPAENPAIVYQPVPCMQCENAPCEIVCPVGATVHSSEGLNDMVYNRCVGTRYCSNNCPYKVRRFNFYQYADFETPVRKLGYNPDVTVRSRGVMEKCTYCVQRINHARIEAKKDNRQIRDGEILTACQQACPTQAIIFGDIRDGESAVSKLKSEPLNYVLLEELNTRPRTSYLARLTNPNVKIGEHKK